MKVQKSSTVLFLYLPTAEIISHVITSSLTIFLLIIQLIFTFYHNKVGNIFLKKIIQQNEP